MRYLALGLTVVLVCCYDTKTAQSKPDAPASSTEAYVPNKYFEHSVLITYKTDVQRDQLLDRILQIWIPVLKQFKAEFVHMKLAVTNPGPSASSKNVTYTIGYKGPKVDLNMATPRFVAAYGKQKMQGVTLLEGDSTTTTENPIWSQPTKYFEHSVLITDKTEAQRDQLVNKILQIWIPVLKQTGVDGVHVKLAVTNPGPTASSKNVTSYYGYKGPQIDLKTAIPRFVAAFNKQKLPGVTLLEGDSATKGKVRASRSLADIPVAALPAVSRFRRQAAAKASMKTIRHTLLIRYITPPQRDNVLKRVLEIWRTLLTTSYGATNVQTSFVSDAQTDVRGYKSVTYDILFSTALPTSSINVQEAQIKFQTEFGLHKVPGVMLLEGNPSVTGTVKIENQTIVHTLVMNYESEDQRDVLLKMILEIWKTVLLKFGVTDISVEFAEEKQQKISTAKIITYRIVYSGPKIKISYKVLIDMFSAAFRVHKVTGVTLIQDIAMAISTHTVTQSMLNTLGISYTTEEQREEKLQQILQLWTIILATYGYRNPRMVVISEEPVPTKILKYKIEYDGEAIENITDEFKGTFGVNLFPNIMIVEGGGEVVTEPPVPRTTKVIIVTVRPATTTTTTEGPAPPPDVEETTTTTEAPTPPPAVDDTTTPPDTTTPETEAPPPYQTPPKPKPTPGPTPKRTPPPPGPPAPTPKPPAPTPKPPSPPVTPAQPRPTIPRGRRRTVFDRK